MPTLIIDNAQPTNCASSIVSSGLICQSSYLAQSPQACLPDIYQEEMDRFQYHDCTQICDDTIVTNPVVAPLIQAEELLLGPEEVGLINTPYCNPEGLPIFISKVIDGEDIIWNFYILGPTGNPELYNGVREICDHTNTNSA